MKRKADTPLFHETRKQKWPEKRVDCRSLQDVILDNEDAFLYTGKLPFKSNKFDCEMKSLDNYSAAPFTAETFHCHTPALFGIAEERYNESLIDFETRYDKNILSLTSLISDFVSKSTNVAEWLETQCQNISGKDISFLKHSGRRSFSLLSFFTHCLDPEILDVDNEEGLELFRSGLFPHAYKVSVPNANLFKTFLSTSVGLDFFFAVVGDKMYDLVPQRIADRMYGISSYDFAIGFHMLIENTLMKYPEMFLDNELDEIEQALTQLKMLVSTWTSKRAIISDPQNQEWLRVKNARSQLLRELNVGQSATFQGGYPGHSQIIHLVKKSNERFKVFLIDGSGLFNTHRSGHKIDPVNAFSYFFTIKELEDAEYFIHDRESRRDYQNIFVTKRSDSPYMTKPPRGMTCTSHTMKDFFRFILGDLLYFKLKATSRLSLMTFVRDGISSIWAESLSNDQSVLLVDGSDLGSISEAELLNTILDNQIVESQIDRTWDFSSHENSLFERLYIAYLDSFGLTRELDWARIWPIFEKGKDHDLTHLISVWSILSVGEWMDFCEKAEEANEFSENDLDTLEYLLQGNPESDPQRQ